ncbi:Box C/D snoRNA protein 1 [Balamuthia mandrillaris]
MEKEESGVAQTTEEPHLQLPSLGSGPSPQQQRHDSNPTEEQPQSSSQQQQRDHKRKEVSCEACGEHPSKYCCPACNLRTCSVACVKRHKEERKCSGRRNKTAFVSLDDFSDQQVVSDFNFLQEGLQTQSVAQIGAENMNQDLTTKTREQVLLKEAIPRNIRLRLIPRAMSRAKQNTSYFHFRSKTFNWRVEWIFPCAPGFSTHDKVIKETEVLYDVLRRHLEKHSTEPQLAPYRDYPAEKLLLCMKVEFQPAERPIYYHVSPTDTLQTFLPNKDIIEFPSFHVVLPTAEAKLNFPEVPPDFALPPDLPPPKLIQHQLPALSSSSHHHQQRRRHHHGGRLPKNWSVPLLHPHLRFALPEEEGGDAEGGGEEGKEKEKEKENEKEELAQ